MREKHKVAINGILRVYDMVKAVREFSKQDTGDFTTVSLDDVVKNSLLLSPQIRTENIKLTEEVEPGLMVHGNKVQLENVLVNLIGNGTHAVGKNDLANRRFWLKVYRKNDDKVRIEFEDNGYGIPPGKDPKRGVEFREAIFMDFVTTKASSTNTGMGLSHCRKTIDRHKGRIWAESEGEGKGAKFVIELPLWKDEVNDDENKNSGS